MSDQDLIRLMRTVDPGRGAFCKTDKLGNPMPEPPVQRNPLVQRGINPRGVRHIDKTAQDHIRKDHRPRVALNDRQREYSRERKPTVSADYVRCPRDA